MTIPESRKIFRQAGETHRTAVKLETTARHMHLASVSVRESAETIAISIAADILQALSYPLQKGRSAPASPPVERRESQSVLL